MSDRVAVSLAVMAHPARADAVARLIGALDREPVVVWDVDDSAPSGNAERVWATARRGWLAGADAGADWHVLIQDDALPAARLTEGLSAALAVPPADSVVSLYLGRGGMTPRRWSALAERAERAGAAWVRARRVMWGVGLAIPTRDIGTMVAWCDRRYGQPDDMRFGMWATHVRRPVWYTWPSLVDHDTSLDSLTKHRAKERRAMRVAPDAAAIDWHGPIVTDPLLAMSGVR